MTLTESQQNHLDIINRNVTDVTDDHDDFMNSMETLLSEGIDVPAALLEIYGTDLD